jgi:ParB/RepB/Spo0J family partition protein
MSGLDFLKDALQTATESNLSGKSVLILPIEKVELDPENPRKSYDAETIKELALSIHAVGQLQPISVRHAQDEKTYYCNFGSSRTLAIKWLQENMPDSPHAKTIEAVLNNDFQPLAKLTENIQRSGLTPLEIAESLSAQIAEGLTPKELGDTLGKDKTWISRHLALNDIDAYTADLVKNKRILNVEAILNFDKIYKANEHYATCMIETLKQDDKVTNALSRTWAKNLKDNNLNPETVVIGIDEPENAQTVTDTVQPELNEKVAQDDPQGAVISLESGLKDEVAEAEKALKEKGKRVNEKASKGVSVELKTAYKDGVLQSYTYLLDVIANGGEERSALAKQILISLACEQQISVNWLELSKHTDLLNEVIVVLEAFKTIGYVSPLNHPSEQILVLVQQQPLV